MGLFIELVIEDLLKIKDVKKAYWAPSITPKSAHFKVIDKKNGVWLIGGDYPGVKCPMHKIITSLKNPHYTEELPEIGLALKSYYHKKLGPIMADELTQENKKHSIDKILSKIHYRYLKKITPASILYDLSLKDADLMAYFKQIQNLNNQNEFYLNGNQFKSNLEEWLNYSKIVNTELLEIKKDLELGLFLNKPYHILKKYFMANYNLKPWLALELSYVLAFCPAHIKIFPFMPDFITAEISQLILKKLKHDREKRNHKPKTINKYGPRKGSNWTGD
jgi:hypothetical protein